MTVTTEDQAIRDWARATGRTVGARGRVPDELRREFEAITAEASGAPVDPAAAAPPPPPAVPDDRGAESVSKPPGPAAQETPPRKVRPPASGIRARAQRALSGSGRRAPKRRPGAARAGLDRVSTERLVERVWDGLARSMQPVNLPVARCLAWQAPTAGAIMDDAVKGTVVDRVLQPLARAEARLEKIGALVGPPVFVMALQLPQNQPVRLVEVVDERSGEMVNQAVPWPAGAIRHQFLLTALAESLEMCVEAQAQLPEDVRARQAEREAKRDQMREIVEMFFAAPPADAAAAAAEEEAMRRARDHARGV